MMQFRVAVQTEEVALLCLSREALPRGIRTATQIDLKGLLVRITMVEAKRGVIA